MEHIVQWGEKTPPLSVLKQIKAQFGVAADSGFKGTPPYLSQNAGHDQFRRALLGWQAWWSHRHGSSESQLAEAISISSGVTCKPAAQDDAAWLAYVQRHLENGVRFYLAFDLSCEAGQTMAINAARAAEAAATAEEIEGVLAPETTGGPASGPLIERSIENILMSKNLIFLANNAVLREVYAAAGINLQGGTATTPNETFHGYLMKRLVKAGICGHDVKLMYLECSRIHYTADKARKLIHGSSRSANSGQNRSTVP